MSDYVDVLARVDWKGIILAAASSSLGVLALIIIVLGLVIVVLFSRERNPKYRLAAFIFLLIGFSSFAWAVVIKLPEPISKPVPKPLSEPEAAWLRVGPCDFERQLTEDRRVRFNISKFPADSHNDNSLILRATLRLPSTDYKQRNKIGVFECPYGFEFLKGAVTLGVNKYELPSGALTETDDSGCEIADLVPIIGAQGTAAITRALNDIGKYKAATLLIENGPKRQSDIIISFNGLANLLNKDECPREVGEAIDRFRD